MYSPKNVNRYLARLFCPLLLPLQCLGIRFQKMVILNFCIATECQSGRCTMQRQREHQYVCTYKQSNTRCSQSNTRCIVYVSNLLLSSSTLNANQLIFWLLLCCRMHLHNHIIYYMDKCREFIWQIIIL